MYTKAMPIKKIRWSKVYESSEEELIELLDAMNISANRWELEEWETLDTQSSDHEVRLWCAEGSVVYMLDDTSVSLQPGDSLTIPANMPFKAAAGIAGCACYEAVITY